MDELDKDGKSVTVAGERWYVFGMTYRHDGHPFGVEFYARSTAEAMARIRSMRMSAEFDGQIVDSFPANTVGRLYVRFVMWWRGLKWNR